MNDTHTTKEMNTEQNEHNMIVNKHTIGEFMEIATRTSKSGSSRSKDDKWAHGSWDEAVRMAVEGYPEGAIRLKQRAGLFAKIREAKRPVARWSVAGSVVDIGRYLSGENENMVEVVRGRAQSPVLKLCIERCVSANTYAEDIENTGASVLAAVECLRTAGVPAEVWVSFTTTSWGKSTKPQNSIQVRIQEAGRPIDIDVLAYWTMHPTALRRLAFAYWEQSPTEIRDQFGFWSTNGYGGASTPANKDTEFDEFAPATSYEVEQWLTDVVTRRAGITIKKDGE